MAERKEQKEAQAASPLGTPLAAARLVALHLYSGPNRRLGDIDQDAVDLAHALSLGSFYRTLIGEERAKEDPVFSFVSYRSDEKEFRAWLIKKFGPVTDYEPDIEPLMSEIDRSIERMRRDRSEIDRLKEETRAAIARLKVA